jgi:hypothetical protein
MKELFAQDNSRITNESIGCWSLKQGVNLEVEPAERPGARLGTSGDGNGMVLKSPERTTACKQMGMLCAEVRGVFLGLKTGRRLRKNRVGANQPGFDAES